MRSGAMSPSSSPTAPATRETRGWSERRRAKSPLLGEIHTVGRGQEHAADAALKWIRGHCASQGLEILRVEDLNDQYPEDQRPHFAWLRFFITRPERPDVSQWGVPASPSPRSGGSRSRAYRRC